MSAGPCYYIETNDGRVKVRHIFRVAGGWRVCQHCGKHRRSSSVATGTNSPRGRR